MLTPQVGQLSSLVDMAWAFPSWLHLCRDGDRDVFDSAAADLELARLACHISVVVLRSAVASNGPLSSQWLPTWELGFPRGAVEIEETEELISS